jgi:hypothetical protein
MNPVIDEFGSKRWYNNIGELHRTDGPAIEWYDGSKEWFVNGVLHRTDGPAMEDIIGFTEWWFNGKKHRLDGPAFEDNNDYCYINGIKTFCKEWWLDGDQIRCNDNHEFLRIVKMKELL